VVQRGRPRAVCRAILAAAGDLSHPAVVSQLAAATAHSPGIAAAGDCLEGGCGHRPGSIAATQEWEYDLLDAIAVCWKCSLLRGQWAGEQEGSLLEAGHGARAVQRPVCSRGLLRADPRQPAALAQERPGHVTVPSAPPGSRGAHQPASRAGRPGS